MIFVFFHLFWIAVCFAGEWSEWEDASLCSAKPCGCPLDEKSVCGTGSKVQFRHCNHAGSDDIKPCAYDKHGPIRTTECTAESGKQCPGWSEWKPITNCACAPYEEFGLQDRKRVCNNPAPIYEDKPCAAVDGGFLNEETEEGKNCTCTNIVTTAATEKPDDVRLCCCEKERLDGSSKPEPVTEGTVFGRGRRQAEKSPDYFLDCITDKEDPNCCKSQAESTTAGNEQTCCCEIEGLLYEDPSDYTAIQCITNEVDPNCCKSQQKNYEY